MNLNDLPPKPLAECTIDEAISRLVQNRRARKSVGHIAAAATRATKTQTKTKAQSKGVMSLEELKELFSEENK